MKVVEVQIIHWSLSLRTMDSHYLVSAISKVKQTTHFSPDTVSRNDNILIARQLQENIG